jgi:hypothetical protein
MITERVPPGFSEAVELIEQEMAEEPVQETVSCILLLCFFPETVTGWTNKKRLGCIKLYITDYKRIWNAINANGCTV